MKFRLQLFFLIISFGLMAVGCSSDNKKKQSVDPFELYELKGIWMGDHCASLTTPLAKKWFVPFLEFRANGGTGHLDFGGFVYENTEGCEGSNTKQVLDYGTIVSIDPLTSEGENPKYDVMYRSDQFVDENNNDTIQARFDFADDNAMKIVELSISEEDFVTEIKKLTFKRINAN